MTNQSPAVVEAIDVRLAYRRPRHRVATLKQAAISAAKRRLEYEDWLALDGVSFTLGAGEVLAVLGRNGAGKSTLLKVLARVLPPTSGRVIVRGHVAPMIELGAGFNPELTAAENILLYSTLLGRTPKQAQERMLDIAAWADLTEHLEVPLRAYSSGMVARLGFAIATDVTPELLLIDEVLSVGDEDFRERSAARTREMMTSGAAVVLVTHDIAAARELATRAMWLDHGHVRAIGDVNSVADAYLADIHQ